MALKILTFSLVVEIYGECARIEGIYVEERIRSGEDHSFMHISVPMCTEFMTIQMDSDEFSRIFESGLNMNDNFNRERRRHFEFW